MCWLRIAVLLPYHHLSIIARAKRLGSIKNARKLNVNLLFIFVRISVKTTFIVPKIAFIKELLISLESDRGPVDCKRKLCKLNSLMCTVTVVIRLGKVKKSHEITPSVCLQLPRFS